MLRLARRQVSDSKATRLVIINPFPLIQHLIQCLEAALAMPLRVLYLAAIHLAAQQSDLARASHLVVSRLPLIKAAIRKKPTRPPITAGIFAIGPSPCALPPASIRPFPSALPTRHVFAPLARVTDACLDVFEGAGAGSLVVCKPAIIDNLPVACDQFPMA